MQSGFLSHSNLKGRSARTIRGWAYGSGLSEEGGSPVLVNSRVWRVRPWIRVVAVLISVLLTVGASPAMERRLNPNGIPAGDQAIGYLLAAASILATWLLAVRPRVCLGANGTVEVRNPFKTTNFPAQGVTAITPRSDGVQFALRGGSHVWAIVFQDTGALSGEPRWFDLAEAVTGERPLKPHWDDDDYDDEPT
jgi:hypothetical protein